MARKKAKRTSQSVKKMEHKKRLTREKILISLSNEDPNKHNLHDWTKNELKFFVNTVKKLESHDNVSYLSDAGLNPKKIDDIEFPKNISPDVSCVEIRCSKKQRLFGFFVGNIYHIVWFDRNHIET